MKEKQPMLILASASPRRLEILKAHGLSPIVVPSDIDECLPEDEELSPEDTAIYLAEQKAFAVLDRMIAEGIYGVLSAADANVTDASMIPDKLKVLAVDTIVYKDEIIGKPVDEEDALRILRMLRNTSHEVISGTCIFEIEDGEIKIEHAFSDTTVVTFGDYTDEEILEYVRAEKPYDKSGSYAIQSSWGKHVLSREGSLENVIGLPWEEIEPYLISE